MSSSEHFYHCLMASGFGSQESTLCSVILMLDVITIPTVRNLLTINLPVVTCVYIYYVQVYVCIYIIDQGTCRFVYALYFVRKTHKNDNDYLLAWVSKALITKSDYESFC